MEERLEQAELDMLWLPGDPIASVERLAAASAEPGRSELVRAELETQRARALGLQGRFAEAEALLESLEPAVGRLEVRVLLERGRLRAAEGRDDAAAVLQDALRAARRDADAALAVEAAAVLAEVDAPHAEQWIDEALSDLSATDDPRTLRWGSVLHERRGWARLAGGDPAAALVSFEDAVGLARRYGTPQERFAARRALARCLRALGRTDEALTLERLLAAERLDDQAASGETPTIES